jgi:hypothetical protein
MKIASTLSVAFLAGLSVATWTLLASAQQVELQNPAGWAAAAAQCRAEVGNQYPTAGESEGMRTRKPKDTGLAYLTAATVPERSTVQPGRELAGASGSDDQL